MVSSKLHNEILPLVSKRFKKLFTKKNLLNIFLIPSALLLITTPAYAVTIDEMLVNLQNQIVPLTQFVTGFAYVSGIFLIFKSVYALKQYGESRMMSSSNTDLRGPISGIIIGSCLLFLPTIVTTTFVSVYGTNSPTEYPTGDTGWDTMAETLVLIVQFVGGVAFIRGLFHFYKLGHGQAQQNTFGKALVHIIGGIIALNIVGAKDILFTTLGMQ